MEKVPEETVILAQEGECIPLRLESPENPIEDNPVFLLNGSTDAVGDTLGFQPRENPTTSFSTSVHLEETGDHIAHAIWATDGQLNLKTFETLDEIRREDRFKVVEWEIHVFPELATLDDIRQVIDDLIRVGTVAWAGKALLEKLDAITFSEEDSSNDEGVDEDGKDEYFQEVLSNFE